MWRKSWRRSSSGRGTRIRPTTRPDPEAFGIAEAASRLSALTDRTVRYEEETPEAGGQWRAATGAAEHEVDVWIGSYLAMASGELSATSDTVERLVGRKPMTLEAYFAKYPARLGLLRNR